MKKLCEIEEATRACEAELAKYREKDPDDLAGHANLQR
jgi:hypothetical protein